MKKLHREIKFIKVTNLFYVRFLKIKNVSLLCWQMGLSVNVWMRWFDLIFQKDSILLATLYSRYKCHYLDDWQFQSWFHRIFCRWAEWYTFRTRIKVKAIQIHCHHSRHVVLLVLANKQDLPNKLTKDEIEEHLQLNRHKNLVWQVSECCVATAEGVYDALDWLATNVKNKLKS